MKSDYGKSCRQTRLRSLLMGVLFLPHVAVAEIREIKTMKDIVPEVTRDTLLVFDIDNTLLEPSGNYGSDQWFYYLYKIYKIQGLSEQEIETKAMDSWNKAQNKIQIEAVEQSTPELIRALQSKGTKTLAVTARRRDLSSCTVNQLNSVDINLAGSTISSKELFIPKETFNSKDDVLFKKGILFVGESNNKGQVLISFLSTLKISPNKIIYVDDKLKHVKNMESASEKAHLPYLGFRYGALDNKIAQFNEVMSEVIDLKSQQAYLLGQLQ